MEEEDAYTDGTVVSEEDLLTPASPPASSGITSYDIYLNETLNFEGNETNPYYFYKTEQLTFLWILFIVIVMGNCAVLSALTLSKSKKSRMNFFIMHLAIADLSVGLISVLTDIVWKITLTWYAGNSGCKIIRFLQVLVTYSSTYVLVALSIDRYDAITHPMNFSGSWKRAKWLIAIAWIMSTIFSVPMLFLYSEKSVQGQLQCWIELPETEPPMRYWQLYMSLVAVSLFIVPTFIITACYTIIVYTIWSKGKILLPKSQCGRGDQSKSLAGKGDVDCKRASSRGLIPKAKIKTVKMTFAIVFVFIICWSPYILYDLLQVFGYIPDSKSNMAIATFIQSMAPLNSAANPMIYCFFSTHICRNLRQISLINWIAETLCCCGHRGGSVRENTYSTRRSEYTTVSEALSRSSHRSHANSISRARLNSSRGPRNHLSSNCIAIKELKNSPVDIKYNACANSQV